MEIKHKELGPVQANCYVVRDGGHALIIDPGGSFPEVRTFVDGDQVDAVLLTHAHFDHIGGLDELLKIYPVPVYVYPSEVNALADPQANVSESFYAHIVSYAKAEPITEGHHQIGHFDVDVIHTPGHSEGSVVYLIGDAMFSGDTLFQGSVGRVDLPGGSYREMEASLLKLKALKKNYHVYPGHGPESTLDQEKIWNPYLR